jgi:hypothetical protein
MNIMGYLQWQFRGILTNVMFWGVTIGILGFVALIMDCPQPWPLIMSSVGLAVVLVDAAVAWVRLSYRMYQSEQQQMLDTLQKKEQP